MNFLSTKALLFSLLMFYYKALSVSLLILYYILNYSELLQLSNVKQFESIFDAFTCMEFLVNKSSDLLFN